MNKIEENIFESMSDKINSLKDELSIEAIEKWSKEHKEEE